MKGFVNLTQTNNGKIEKILTNEIVITPLTSGFRAGRNAQGYGVAIGENANAGGDSVCIGRESRASVMSTALGWKAKSFGDYAMQLNMGYNDQKGTLQFRDFRIVGKDGKLYTNLGTEKEVNMGLVASEQYVKDLMNSVSGGVDIRVVDVLPTENISATSIYLVSNASGTYDEYLYVNNKWEQIGTTEINLDDYYNKNDIDSLLSALSGGVSLEDFNKLVNNEVQIKNSSNGFYAGGTNTDTAKKNEGQIVIGNGSYSTARSDIVLGGSAVSYTVSNNNDASSVVIGSGGRNRGARNIAIGNDAKTGGENTNQSIDNAIQLGRGQNLTTGTLQIFNDNIYNHNTHTLTVQNIELNGVNLGTQLGDLNTALETILGV